MSSCFCVNDFEYYISKLYAGLLTYATQDEWAIKIAASKTFVLVYGASSFEIWLLTLVAFDVFI